MNKKVLVVGGAGYLGGAITDKLIENNIEFTVYDNLLYEDRYLKNVNYIFGDVRDTKKLGKIINNFDIVIWLAAIVGDGACAVNPDYTIEINEKSVEWLSKNFNGKILFPSTCSVYGCNRNKNLDENAEVNPLSLYAGTKLNCEKILIERGNSVMFRLGTLYGLSDYHSRPRLDLVINILTMKAANGEKLTVFGGEQWRPVIHVKDVANAFISCILDENWSELNGIYNLSQQNVCINEISDLIKKHIDCEVSVQDMKFEDLRDYHVSIDKLIKSVGNIKFEHNLDDSIKKLIQFYDSKRIKNVNESTFHNAKYIQQKFNV